LLGNFGEKKTANFSIEMAIRHLHDLKTCDKQKAADYIRKAPDYIDTPLRCALQNEPWFTEL